MARRGVVIVVLVRHGEADADGRCYGARHDVGLSALGSRQAAAVAASIGAPARLLSSPARRAVDSAAFFDLVPEQDARWAERDFGAWEGRPWADCWAEVPEEITRDPDLYARFSPPEAEPLESVQERVGRALDDLAPTLRQAPTVVVTHAGPIRLALRHALGLTVPQCFAFAPAPGSATWLRRVGQSWVVDRVGA